MLNPFGKQKTILVVLACLAVVAGCADVDRPPGSQAVPEIRPGTLAGYLPPGALPNSLAVIPAPPGEGSAALALDRQSEREARELRNTPRWRLAAEDADLTFPHAAGAFSCALNAPVTEKDTPHLYTLMRRSMTDVGLSTYRAKDAFKRARPFVVNAQPSCTPREEKRLSSNGSYPSGHAAIGWAWALILTEIAPDRADALLARGRSFGESRVICGVHWQSDVVAGRLVGAGTVARLHADPVFRADLEAARKELLSVLAKGLLPTRDCSAEAAAMSANH